MEKNGHITVVIPNYNGEMFLENCVKSLEKQTYTNFEIVVVDDCSKDDSLEILKKYPEIRVLMNDKNSGFAASVNRGIKAAQGEFVLLLNNDVELESDFIEKMYGSITANARIFSVSSRMVRYYERDKLDDTGDFYNILGWAYKRGDGKSINRHQRRTKVFSTCAGAGLYRRSVFDEIGLFDENFFAYLEDVDVSYRGQIYGYCNIYEPEAICYHIGSATTAEGNKYSAFKVEISARNNIYTAYKNMPLFQLIINLPFLCTGFLIKGFMFVCTGYGKSYFKGLGQGLKNLRKTEKTQFHLKHMLNYLKIEMQLLMNVFRYMGEKLS